MFDISFAKLVVLGVVALIVLGPERLPAVARFVGLMLGRMQRFVANVKADMNQQLQETGLNNLHQDLKDVTQNVRDGVQNALNDVQDSLKEASEHYYNQSRNDINTENNHLPESDFHSPQTPRETTTSPTAHEEKASSDKPNDIPPL